MKNELGGKIMTPFADQSKNKKAKDTKSLP